MLMLGWMWEHSTGLAIVVSVAAFAAIICGSVLYVVKWYNLNNRQAETLAGLLTGGHILSITWRMETCCCDTGDTTFCCEVVGPGWRHYISPDTLLCHNNRGVMPPEVVDALAASGLWGGGFSGALFAILMQTMARDERFTFTPISLGGSIRRKGTQPALAAA